MLGLFNNWNIITISHKSTKSEAFEEIQKIVLYVISENMVFLVQPGKYGAMNTKYYTTIGYYVINFASEAHTIQTCYTKLCDKNGNVWGLYDKYICVILNPIQTFVPCVEIIFFINHYFLICILKYCTS